MNDVSLPPALIKETLLEISVSGKGLCEKLLEKAVVSVDRSAGFLQDHLNAAIVDLSRTDPSPSALNALPEETARHHCVCPISVDGEKLTIAVVDPTDFDLIRQIRFVSGREVVCVVASRSAIERKIEEAYSRKGPASPVPEKQAANPPVSINTVSRSPAVRLVNELIATAIRRGVSDIHFEPFENELKVRYRLDGLLQEVQSIPNSRKNEVLSRLKIMASLDIAEKRRPQDGRIRADHEGRAVDLRVSTLPTGHGEKIVLRILDKTRVSLDLTILGMEVSRLEEFRRIIVRPYGMVLVTGPTGSGKTTTLYAALNHVKSAAVNISTVEDPIEYHMDGVNQTQAKPEIGLTFASALRTLLRQDPNIIMVGEIRDRDTADIAVRAALTGHMVFSTLHTNDAPGAMTRLLDMGIEPFLISSSVSQVVAQRLVRRICPNCREEAPAKGALAADLGISGTVYAGKGCVQCGNTGYKGRIGLYEVLTVNEDLKRLIVERRDAGELKAAAVKAGMVTLRMDGVAKIKAGITTVEEVIRETINQT